MAAVFAFGGGTQFGLKIIAEPSRVLLRAQVSRETWCIAAPTASPTGLAPNAP